MNSIIVGASSVISGWISHALTQRGNRVFCTSRTPSVLPNYSYLDPNSDHDIQEFLHEIEAKSISMDSVYYCCGSMYHSSISKADRQLWIKDFEVNLFGAFTFYNSICNSSLISPNGIRYIVIGSTSSISKPSCLSSYWISKLALEGMITAINNEQPSNIRACTLRLGRCNAGLLKTDDDPGLIHSHDLIKPIELIEESPVHLLPELLAIRPILSS